MVELVRLVLSSKRYASFIFLNCSLADLFGSYVFLMLVCLARFWSFFLCLLLIESMICMCFCQIYPELRVFH